MSFISPVGSDEERGSGIIWPGRWINATGFDVLSGNGYHTGADLNLNYPHWDADAHSKVYAIGAGTVTYAQIYSTKVWGTIIVIDHGMVDGKPLFSRYAHVENIKVSVDQNVEAGQPIASVGNGEGLFPYHLHFDISQTDVLRDKPWHWPGSDREFVRMHYVNPQEWLQAHIAGENSGIIIQPTQDWYVVAPLGVKVRDNPGLSAIKVDVMVFGSKLSIDDAAVNKDTYTWARINSGAHNGDWVAIGKSDQSEIYISKTPPG